MSDASIRALTREERAAERADALGPCVICSSIVDLSSTAAGIRCYEHRRSATAQRETDHVAGVKTVSGFTADLYANDHRRVEQIRAALGKYEWPDGADGDPLLRVAHVLAGMASYVWLITEWLVALDAWLRDQLGAAWFTLAPRGPFA